METIPFHRPSIDSAEIAEVVHTLKSGWLTTGAKTKTFESDFARYLHRKQAVAVNSCTAALHLALEATGLKAGDWVVVPTVTFAATAEVVRYFDARPLLVDCRPSDFNLDVADAARRIEIALARGKKIRAIMPVDFGGQIGDVAGISALAERYNLKIIEDAAHCCPAFYRHSSTQAWRTVGSESDISCFSFYANKTITTGEGGMACTDNAAYTERMRIMSLHGISRDAWKRFTSEGSWYYEITAPGFKYNLTDIAAAIGLQQLRKADELHKKRTQLAECYADLLADVEELILPKAQPDRIHSWHLYVIRLRLDRLSIDRSELIEELKRTGIGTSVHWMPLHMHPYYRETYGYKPDDLPQAARLYPEIISLPIFPDMSLKNILRVCSELKRIIAGHRKIPGKIPSRPQIPKRKSALEIAAG